MRLERALPGPQPGHPAAFIWAIWSSSRVCQARESKHTFKTQKQHSEGHSLAHLHFTRRLVSRYLCSVQRAGRSNPFSTLLKSAPKFPSQQRERRPWSAPLPKTCRTTRCPRQTVTAPVSHLLFSERVDSDRLRPGRLRHLTVSPNASFSVGLTDDFVPASCLLSFGFCV
ncbi:hypothetical protein QQF64_010431 [Cirrhinus molitorella]|uniref:Uncharacterized protein n=1 Tax=Cirrhinus molitorella TaxID=172907 RepID=A0ABR3M754_9TELE